MGLRNVTIEVLKKIFDKYGFHSLRKEPFLYAKNEEIGISFTFKDPLYGELTRLFLTESEEEAEDFLGKYSWYRKYGQKYQIEIKLSDYKKNTPNISFEKNNHAYTLQEMIALLKEEKVEIKEQEKKDMAYIKKLQRTVTLLEEILREKEKVAQDTYNNFLQLQKEYNQKYIRFETLKKDYEKSKKEIKPLEEKTFQTINIKYPSISFSEDKQKLEEQIDHLLNEIKIIETSSDIIYQKYELIKLPLEIEIINQKIDIVEKALKKKRGLFSKKEKIEDKLAEIDSSSVVNQMVTYESYEKNEQERLMEKYAMIPDLDKRTIGDFLIEFDNLNIKESKVKEPKEENDTSLSYEEVMQDLEKEFESRKNEEKKILTLYHSIIKYLFLKNSIISEKNVEEFIGILDNPNNIMIKLKYFKNIDTSSPKKCIESLKKEAEKIKKINPDVVKGDINVFFKDKKIITSKDYLFASNKRALSPTQTKGENDMNYIAILKKGAYVYFIPNEITYDIENDENLIQKNDQPFFLIDMQKNHIESTNSDIINVVRYQNEMKKEEKFTLVTNLVSVNVDQYKKVVIERNE